MMPTGKGAKVFYGWWIVLIVSLLGFYGAGSFHYGFSVFVVPIVEELGWSMTLVSGAFSLYRLESGLAAPLVGFLLDRVGCRNLVLSGAALMGSGFILLSRVRAPVPFYGAFILLSLGFSFLAGTALGAPLIGKWFVRKRGRAIGLYTGALGVGGVLVPLWSQMIASYGWRSSLLFIGIFTFLFVPALSRVLRDNPEVCNLVPDGNYFGNVEDENAPLEKDRGLSEQTFSVGGAIQTRAFWVLTICFLIFQINMSALFVHLVPALTLTGIEPKTAAFTMTFLVLISVAGRMGFGLLGDLYSRKRLLVFSFCLQLAGVVTLSRVRQVAQVIPFLMTCAPSYGAIVALKPAIAAEFYGRRYFGTIFGLIQGISTIGGITGPVLMGMVYDRYGNYDSALQAIAMMNVLPIVLLLYLRPPNREE